MTLLTCRKSIKRKKEKKEKTNTCRRIVSFDDAYLERHQFDPMAWLSMIHVIDITNLMG